jgi:SAM-dependent methyltransferase
MYDAFPDLPELYDSVPIYAARGDVQFYIDEARDAGGSVLEIGCGTGRVLLPIARSGHTITGVDASPQMLERCRSKLRAEPGPVQSRVALYEGDARAFDLGRQFDLVIAPFRVMQHMTTIEDQVGFLSSAARHLAPGGRLAFDVFNPNFAILVSAGGMEEREDTPETTLPHGRRFRRAGRVSRVRWIDQVSEIELIYYITGQAGGAERRVQSFDMRWFLRAELVNLLARSGFQVRSIYGDFDRSQLTDKSPEQIVCAERATAPAP